VLLSVAFCCFLSNVESLLVFCFQRTKKYTPIGVDPSVSVGFGVQLRGREDVMKIFAANEDTKAGLIRRETHLQTDAVSKESITIPTCFGAVATGKTALAEVGLDACKRFCQDSELKTLLASENLTLSVMISFNGTTTITPNELQHGNIELSATRRFLAEYFSLSLLEAETIPLSDTYSFTDCLRVIASDHRKQHNMAPASKLFMYLAVDDVNLLVDDTAPHRSDRVRHRVRHLKGVSQMLQRAAWGGVKACYVSVMLAGTNYVDMKDAFLGSGVPPFPLHLQSLTSEQLIDTLKDAKVDQMYIDSPKFQALLVQTGSSLRALGEGVSGLQHKFLESSIKDAEAKIHHFFNQSFVSLNQEEVLKLHALAVTGHLALARLPLTGNSSRTLESLEVDGFLKLVRTTGNDEWVAVDVPEMRLRFWSRQTEDKLTLATHDLVGVCNNTTGWQWFELFVARYHCLKMNMLCKLDLGETVTLGEFYRGAKFQDASPVVADELWGDCADLRICLPVDHYCEAIDLKGRHFIGPNEDDKLAGRLKKGDVLRESAGAATDLVAVHSVRSADKVEQKPLVCLIHAAHTIDATKLLTEAKIKADREKTVMDTSKHFSAAERVHVHVSTRILPNSFPALPTSVRGAVYIGREQCTPVFGQLFGRLLTSYKGQTTTPRKQPFCSGRRVMLRPAAVGPSSWGGVALLAKAAKKLW
jgi:hypothetical protein